MKNPRAIAAQLLNLPPVKLSTGKDYNSAKTWSHCLQVIKCEWEGRIGSGKRDRYYWR